MVTTPGERGRLIFGLFVSIKRRRRNAKNKPKISLKREETEWYTMCAIKLYCITAPPPLIHIIFITIMTKLILFRQKSVFILFRQKIGFIPSKDCVFSIPSKKWVHSVKRVFHSVKRYFLIFIPGPEFFFPTGPGPNLHWVKWYF